MNWIDRYTRNALHIDLSWLGVGGEEEEEEEEGEVGDRLQEENNKACLSLTFPQVVAEPFKTLVKTVSRGGTSRLNILYWSQWKFRELRTEISLPRPSASNFAIQAYL